MGTATSTKTYRAPELELEEPERSETIAALGIPDESEHPESCREAWRELVAAHHSFSKFITAHPGAQQSWRVLMEPEPHLRKPRDSWPEELREFDKRAGARQRAAVRYEETLREHRAECLAELPEFVRETTAQLVSELESIRLRISLLWRAQDVRNFFEQSGRNVSVRDAATPPPVWFAQTENQAINARELFRILRNVESEARRHASGLTS